MNNIENLLNTAQAENVFRQHHITGRGINGVRQGFEAKGNHFMIDLVKAVSPGSVLTNGNFGDNTDILTMLDQANAADAAKTTGKGWAFWEKALTFIGKTGTTLSAFKSDILGTPAAAPDPAVVATQKRNNTIIYVVAVVILVIVGVLLFKKK